MLGVFVQFLGAHLNEIVDVKHLSVEGTTPAHGLIALGTVLGEALHRKRPFGRRGGCHISQWFGQLSQSAWLDPWDSG